MEEVRRRLFVSFCLSHADINIHPSENQSKLGTFSLVLGILYITVFAFEVGLFEIVLYTFRSMWFPGLWVRRSSHSMSLHL